MQIALQEAEIANKKGYIPIGAALVFQNEIIATAHNEEFWHAEILCIQKAQSIIGKYLENTTMFITIEPCKMCMHALRLARVRTVVFGAANQNEPLPPIETVSCICENEAKKLMQEFFEKRR